VRGWRSSSAPNRSASTGPLLSPRASPEPPLPRGPSRRRRSGRPEARFDPTMVVASARARLMRMISRPCGPSRRTSADGSRTGFRRIGYLGSVVSQGATDCRESDHTRCCASHCTIPPPRARPACRAPRAGHATPAAARASAMRAIIARLDQRMRSASTSTPTPRASEHDLEVWRPAVRTTPPRTPARREPARDHGLGPAAQDHHRTLTRALVPGRPRETRCSRSGERIEW